MSEETQKIPVYIKKSELEDTKLTDYNIDYTEYADGNEMLTVLEDDGTRWATAFAQFYKKKYEVDINVQFAFVWFANVIEHTNKIRKEREEQSQKDLETEIEVDSKNK
jgi:hypothetical protein